MKSALLVAGALFAIVSGVNDGGALVALGLKVPGTRPIVTIAILSVAVVASPPVFGTAVATTIARKLVPFHGPDGRTAALLGIVACVAVVGVLARLRLPTSLTLATVGGLIGAGVGFGFHASWSTIGLVVAVGVIAPVVGGCVASLVATTLRVLSVPVSGRTVRVAHYGAFALESLAYGANDAQRMLAVFAIAAGLTTTRVQPHAWQLGAIFVCFAVGAIVGMYRYARTFGSDLVPARPHHTPVAELAAAGASFGGMALGAPLSITQSASAGLIGAAGPEHWLQVRWRRTARLALACVLTVPSAFALGLALGLVGSSL
ncbi:MAG TPA: inorganic phosphate transporter [Acidimicrobiia bacterium]|nr:inorganic phosphate transporter [Acidimicrobiia bacterium]